MRYQFLSLIMVAVLGFSCSRNMPAPFPVLQKKGSATQLMVDGKPFLVLGGELHNSSASSMEYMDNTWPLLKKMNLNTVLAVVSWDQFEPVEGQYDYTLTDYLINKARENDLRLIILWFGSWKNGISGYVPQWVKKDLNRFPRVKDRNGSMLEIITPFSDQICDADAKAFANFMKHLRESDANYRTVIMIQVENEVGMHSDSRDRGELAEKAFNEPVPAALVEYLKSNKSHLTPELAALWGENQFKEDGTWQEMFGEGAAAEELFMAWHYAVYVNAVAAAGKKEYPLPMFVNAWLVQHRNNQPGDYPSGGPVAHVLDIWKAGAPQIDFLAPDIYLPYFSETVEKYSHAGNPLFIPESRSGKTGAGNAMLAIARYNAIGYSPFGIDGSRMDLDTLPKMYSLLDNLSGLILTYQGTDSMTAVTLTRDNPVKTVSLGDYDLTFSILVNRRTRQYSADSGYGMAVMANANEFFVSGNDIQVTFIPNKSDSVAGFLLVEEGKFRNGKWEPGRWLNGDEVQLRYDLGNAALERLSGEGLKFRTEQYDIQRVLLYKYK